MGKSKPLLFSLLGTNVLLYLSIFVYSLVLFFNLDLVSVKIIGIVMLLIGLEGIVESFLNFKDKLYFSFALLVGIMMSTFSLVILLREHNFIHICLYWGIVELVKSTLEMIRISLLSYRDKKVSKFAMIDFLLAVIALVFSIILIIKKSEGLRAHVLVLSLSSLVAGVMLIIDNIFEYLELKNSR